MNRLLGLVLLVCSLWTAPAWAQADVSEHLTLGNTQSVKKGWKNYVTTIREIEHLTGFDFFSELPKAIQNVIETRKDDEE